MTPWSFISTTTTIVTEVQEIHRIPQTEIEEDVPHIPCDFELILNYTLGNLFSDLNHLYDNIGYPL